MKCEDVVTRPFVYILDGMSVRRSIPTTRGFEKGKGQIPTRRETKRLLLIRAHSTFAHVK